MEVLRESTSEYPSRLPLFSSTFPPSRLPTLTTAPTTTRVQPGSLGSFTAKKRQIDTPHSNQALADSNATAFLPASPRPFCLPPSLTHPNRMQRLAPHVLARRQMEVRDAGDAGDAGRHVPFPRLAVAPTTLPTTTAAPAAGIIFTETRKGKSTPVAAVRGVSSKVTLQTAGPVGVLGTGVSSAAPTNVMPPVMPVSVTLSSFQRPVPSPPIAIPFQSGTSNSTSLGASTTSSTSSGTPPRTIALIIGLSAVVLGLAAFTGWWRYKTAPARRRNREERLIAKQGGVRKGDEEDGEVFGNSFSPSAYGGGHGGGWDPDQSGEKSFGEEGGGGGGGGGGSNFQLGQHQPFQTTTNANGRPFEPILRVDYPPQTTNVQPALIYASFTRPSAVADPDPFSRTPYQSHPTPIQPLPPANPAFADSDGPGKIRVVKRTFEPSLADELIVFPGDRVRVLMAYDDGWALGINIDSTSNPSGSIGASGQTKGVFPFDCLEDPLTPSGPSLTFDPLIPVPLPPTNNNFPSPTSSPTKRLPSFQPDPSAGAGAYEKEREMAPQLGPLVRNDSPFNAHFPSSAGTLDRSGGGGNREGVKGERSSSLVARAERDEGMFAALGELGGR